MHSRKRQLGQIHMEDEVFVMFCIKKGRLGLLHAREGKLGP